MNSILYDLYACKLTNLNYDICTGIVNLELLNEESGEKHSLKFIGVSSFMFLNDNECDEPNYVSFEDIINEQIDITLTRNKKTKKNAYKWLNQFEFKFNITIESFNNALLFNCKRIEYNGESINL